MDPESAPMTFVPGGVPLTIKAAAGACLINGEDIDIVVGCLRESIDDAVARVK